jgi:hypothetical protein
VGRWTQGWGSAVSRYDEQPATRNVGGYRYEVDDIPDITEVDDLS